MVGTSTSFVSASHAEIRAATGVDAGYLQHARHNKNGRPHYCPVLCPRDDATRCLSAARGRSWGTAVLPCAAREEDSGCPVISRSHDAPTPCRAQFTAPRFHAFQRVIGSTPWRHMAFVLTPLDSRLACLS